MRILLLNIMLIFPLFLSAKWEKIELPKETHVAEYMFNINDTLIFIIDDIIFVSTNNGYTWENEYNSRTFNYQVTDGYYLIDKNLYRTVANSNNGLPMILKSKDLGRTWETLFVDDKLNAIFKVFKIESNLHYLSNRGLFRSTNDGKDWVLVSNSSLPKFDGIIDNYNDNIIVADKGGANANKGVFISTDGGYNFKNKLSGIDNINYKKFNLVKIYSDYQFIAGEQGLYYSEDLGENWALANFNGTTNRNIISFERVGDTFYAGTNYGEIYKSNNIKSNWEEVYNNGNKGKISLIKSINNNLYFNVWGEIFGNFLLDKNSNYLQSNFKIRSNNVKSKIIKDSLYLLTANNLYCSSSNMKNWLKLTDLESFQYTDFYVDSNNIILSYVISNQFVYSKDFGKTWKDKTIGEFSIWVNDITRHYNKLFISTLKISFYNPNNGLFISEDNGENWYNYNEYHPEINFNFTSIKEINGKLFSGTSRNGIVTSTDKGETWNSLSNDTTNLMNSEFIEEFAVHNNTIIAQSTNTFKIYKSNDLGKSWGEIKDLGNETYIKGLINYKEYFFMITRSGFYYSRDSGSTWSAYNVGIEEIPFSEIAFGKYNLHINKDSLILIYSYGIYTLPLSELGIDYTSVETTENRNYLWTNPPYPQPSNNQVKIKVYWDSELPFTSDDVEIYDLTGTKLNTDGQINVIKENNWQGNITWYASNQSPGIYIMKITHGTETRTRKIIITE